MRLSFRSLFLGLALVVSVSTAAFADPAVGRGSAPAPSALVVPSPIPVAPGSYAFTNRTGTITTGGTAQVWAAPGAITHGCFFQNHSTDTLTLRMDGAVASVTSLWILPNGYFECPITGVPSGGISVYGPTTADAYTGATW